MFIDPGRGEEVGPVDMQDPDAGDPSTQELPWKREEEEGVGTPWSGQIGHLDPLVGKGRNEQVLVGIARSSGMKGDLHDETSGPTPSNRRINMREFVLKGFRCPDDRGETARF